VNAPYRFSFIAAVAVGGITAAFPAAAVEHIVSLKGATFQPATVNAKIGDTVKFVNDDGVDHEMFVPTKGFGVDLGMQKPTSVTELHLTKPGSFEVECVVHPHMLLNINVSR
jgi:plastocyanin